MKSPILNRCFAEAIGTFGLVFAGTGAIIVNDVTGGAITHSGIALTFGLVVLAMIYAVGDVSGAHLNPAVTIGFIAAGRFPRREASGYIAAQLLGALAASLCWKGMFPNHPTLGSTLPAGSIEQSFILETILTFLLMFVILNVTAAGKESTLIAAIAIGATVGLEAMFAGPICGASMNPARSLAPALVSLHRIDLISLYVAAPLLGSLSAVFAVRRIR